MKREQAGLTPNLLKNKTNEIAEIMQIAWSRTYIAAQLRPFDKKLHRMKAHYIYIYTRIYTQYTSVYTHNFCRTCNTFKLAKHIEPLECQLISQQPRLRHSSSLYPSAIIIHPSSLPVHVRWFFSLLRCYTSIPGATTCRQKSSAPEPSPWSIIVAAICIHLHWQITAKLQKAALQRSADLKTYTH